MHAISFFFLIIKYFSVDYMALKIDLWGFIFNPFPYTAVLQQTMFRKILIVHSAERNEHFFKLEIFENIMAKEEIAPAGAISSFVTMNVFKCRLL